MGLQKLEKKKYDEDDERLDFLFIFNKYIGKMGGCAKYFYLHTHFAAADPRQYNICCVCVCSVRRCSADRQSGAVAASSLSPRSLSIVHPCAPNAMLTDFWALEERVRPSTQILHSYLIETFDIKKMCLYQDSLRSLGLFFLVLLRDGGT